MKAIKQFDIWLANLNPSKGTEPGKIRPVVVVQADSINNLHDSTVICSITSNVLEEVNLIRVKLPLKALEKSSEILVDQIRAIDNLRLIKKIATLEKPQVEELKSKLKIVLDFE